MSMRPLAALALLTAITTACEQTPTSPAVETEPRFAGTGSPRFTEASATGPTTAGQLAISFRMTGVGAKASNLITGSAQGSAVWACRFGTEEFDGFPAPQVLAGPVSGTTTASSGNGQVSGSVTVNPAAHSLDCAAGNHQPVLVSSDFTSVAVTHPDAEPLPVPGTFTRTFFTLPTDPLPVFTAFQPAQTTLAIEGAGVSYTATIQNPGGALSGIAVQMWVKQGSAWRAAGGASVNCGGALGELPNGTCNVQGSAFASNDGTAGAGTLVAGPAVLEINLRGSPSVRVLAGARVDITLQ